MGRGLAWLRLVITAHVGLGVVDPVGTTWLSLDLLLEKQAHRIIGRSIQLVLWRRMDHRRVVMASLHGIDDWASD
jgi:hypothetical protein